MNTRGTVRQYVIILAALLQLTALVAGVFGRPHIYELSAQYLGFPRYSKLVHGRLMDLEATAEETVANSIQ